MNVLGIETSCDETSAALVKDGKKILSNVIFSQNPMHARFRGIVPEIASRAHVEKINGVLEKAIGNERVDALAVTVGPGLIGSLLVGKMAAQALAWVWEKPIVGVNHLEAHLFANALENPGLEPPFLGLIVSGGHTDLVIVQDYGRYRVIGRTRDDAAGESYDKVANLLKLGYPGGPAVDLLAQQGDPGAVPFPKPFLQGSWDFSFSGLKTAVLYYLRKNKKVRVADVCASFQNSVVSVLTAKAVSAAKTFKLGKISVGGGVAANSELRKRFQSEAKKHGLEVYLPSKSLCTDNAAMVAALGFHKLKRQKTAAAALKSLEVDPSLPIRNWE